MARRPLPPSRINPLAPSGLYLASNRYLPTVPPCLECIDLKRRQDDPRAPARPARRGQAHATIVRRKRRTPYRPSAAAVKCGARPAIFVLRARFLTRPIHTSVIRTFMSLSPITDIVADLKAGRMA